MCFFRIYAFFWVLHYDSFSVLRHIEILIEKQRVDLFKWYFQFCIVFIESIYLSKPQKEFSIVNQMDDEKILSKSNPHSKEFARKTTECLVKYNNVNFYSTKIRSVYWFVKSRFFHALSRISDSFLIDRALTWTSLQKSSSMHKFGLK